MGKKYVVELEDCRNTIRGRDKILLGIHTKIGETAGYINTGITLTPYTAPDLEQVRKEAYDNGYEDAEEKYNDGYSDGYDAGLADAWEACKKIINMNAETSEKVFGEGNWFTKEVVESNTATEAITKIKEYEEGKQGIKVWDEIYCVGRPDIKVCVTDVEDGNFSGFTVEHPDNSNIGHVYSSRSFDGWKKTGRHFTEIGTILEKMRGEKE